ncbi:MAG: septation protein A [Alphaproteobacteria bacterium]|nr:MAG: septation protein A [Alphaproteobacteria bacterium]
MSDTKKQLLKLVIEMFPIVLFFYAYDAKDMETVYLATKVFMGAMVISMIASKLVFKKIGLILWISGGLVGILGGATIYFHNELFIKLKPTILYSFFAAALLGGLAFGKFFLKNVFEAGFPPLPDEAWKTLTFRFGLFYVFNAVLNEVIHRNFEFDIWIATKLWLFMPLSLLFMMAQMPMLMKYMDVEEEGSSSE